MKYETAIECASGALNNAFSATANNAIDKASTYIAIASMWLQLAESVKVKFN